MRQIIFSSLGGSINAEDILMGPWCLNNSTDPSKSISKFNVLQDPVSGPALYQYSLESSDISEILLKNLIPKLNKLNNVTYSYDFWRIISTI